MSRVIRLALTAALLVGAAALGFAVLPGARLVEVYPLEGMVAPGTPAHLKVIVQDRPWYDTRPVTVTITAGLDRTPLATLKTRGGTLEWTPPAAGGYGVTARLGSQQASTALDAGTNWAEKPRYGFLSDFSPADRGQADRFETMARFHLNSLQFYDWMYRHSAYLPPTDEFVDPLGRTLSLSTVKEKIELGRRHGMASMAYTAVYGAPREFMESHREWALYDLAGRPMDFGQGFLFIMNLEPGSPWAGHMVNEYRRIVTQLPFDGIHLDQYGDPKFGFRYPGGDGAVGVDVATGIAALIDATKEAVGPAKTVFFNDVNAWPISETAPTSKDAVYVEVWPPNVMFNHLREIIDRGSKLSGGKPVVLAAYISPEYEPSVLLTDAVIFALGGYHIELGEGAAMLADPYFPKYKPMSPGLQAHLRRYYDVTVRYQAFLYGSDLVTWEPEVTVAGSRMLPGGYFNGVWPIGRENGHYRTLSLINLNGLADGKWNSPRQEPPTLLTDRTVTVAMEQAPRALYRIDPDGADQSPVPVAFAYKDGLVTFTLDSLSYWSLLVFEK